MPILGQGPGNGGSPGNTPWAIAEGPVEPSGPERIIPGWTPAQGFGPTLSPDGHTLLYVARRNPETILITRWVDGAWSEPEVAPFSGEWPDQEPFVAPDGRRVFFASRRPHEFAGELRTEYRIWLVDWFEDGTFGEPWLLGPEVNSAGDQSYPAVDREGTLFFARRLPGEGSNLFSARRDGSGFLPAEPLAGLNMSGSDVDPWVDPDGGRLIFSSVRDGGVGQGDLYVAHRCGDAWSEARPLGPLVNTEAYEYTPYVTPDGEWLLFTRDRWDIWRIRLSELRISSPCPPAGG